MLLKQLVSVCLEVVCVQTWCNIDITNLATKLAHEVEAFVRL